MPVSEKQDLRAAIQKALTGGPSERQHAWAAIFECVQPHLFLVALAKVKQPTVADDIVQDAMVLAMRKLENLRKPESFVSWVCRIVTNLSNKYYSRNRLVSGATDEMDALLDEIPARENGNTTVDSDVLTACRDQLDELPFPLRSVAERFYVEQKSLKRIARELRLPVGTVKSRLFTSRQKLLEGLLPTFGADYGRESA